MNDTKFMSDEESSVWVQFAAAALSGLASIQGEHGDSHVDALLAAARADALLEEWRKRK